jgi:hypothetical protein
LPWQVKVKRELTELGSSWVKRRATTNEKNNYKVELRRVGSRDEQQQMKKEWL